MRTLLVAMSLAWPLMLAFALLDRFDGAMHLSSAGLYLAASHVCHQMAERSFHTAGFQWPVCARCTGLYAAAPFGALLAIASSGWRPVDGRLRRWLIAGSLPTAFTLAAEWVWPASMSNEWRALAALPLGAAVALTLVRMAPGRTKTIR